ncbi:MAG TPA: hypothetical protein DHV25_04440 [Candidatus Kerfeldbacteria bacterium]|nr:MAG: FG-GAP repeat protein [Parcubacteria group bacterium GW2011_GWC2_49_9]HCJ52937.1 hypothetical protein [Candidatus Kerfeldbacteria bacterium]
MTRRIIQLIAIAGIAFLAIASIAPAEASGVTVSGKVVSPSGASISGAGGFINLQPEGPVPGSGGNIQSDGTFTITNVQAAQYMVNISYGGTGGYAGPLPYSITVGSTNVNLSNIKLTTPSITGQVTLPNGTPISNGTWVQIRTNDWSFNLGTNTDEFGNFKFGGLADGTFIIEAQPPQDSPYTKGLKTVTYTGTPLTGIVVKLTTPNVTGTIKDPFGDPIVLFEPERINCDMSNQDHTVNENTSTDQNGVFRFPTIPSGSYTIVCRPELLPFTSNVPKTVNVTSGVLLNAGTIKLTIPQVQGVVLAPGGSTPVPNAWVNVHTQDWSVNQGANTDQSGLFRVGGLPAGTYQIDVNPPWGTNYISPEPSTVTVGGSVVNKMLTFINATKFVSGKVTRTNGQAIAGASVNANKEGGSGWANTQTNALGEYELALSGGAWNIMVNPNMAPGAPPADWFFSGPPQRVTFALNQTVENKSLNLKVQNADAAVVGRVVRADGTPLGDANVDVRNQEGIGNNAQVHPDGTFRVNVSAGTYKLFVWTPDNTLNFNELNVTVGEGQTKNVGTLTAKAKLARITGRVVNEQGEGIPNVRLNTWKFEGQGWSNTQSDSNGNFNLAVTEGRWGVNIDQGSNVRYVYGGKPIEVDLQTETAAKNVGTLELTFADATITGFVVDTGGNVVTGFCGWAEARPNTGASDFGFGPGYGASVDCQSGQFTIYVPSSVASTYALAVHTPPNSEFSPQANQNVAVFSNTTSTKNIVLKKNDATVKGKLLDQNGDPIDSCVSPFGWFGDIHFDREGSWRGGEIHPDCTYSVSLLSGDGYHMGYWIDPQNGYMMKPSSPEPINIESGVTTMNITVNKADATVTGRVIDPNGNGVDAWVFGGNWPELGGDGGPKAEDFANELHADTKTDPDGTFTLNVLTGHLYEIGAGLPPESEFMPPDFQRVDMNGQDSASVTLQLERALGTMTGTVRIGGGAGAPVNHGFVHCWEENGGFTGGPVDFGGSYSVNYRAGTWHCGADSFDGETFYQSEEVLITVTDQEELSQDFNLDESLFTVPPAVTTTFDAGTVQTISLENGTRINIPAGALGQSGSNVTVTATPTVDLFRTKTSQPFGVGYDLQALDADNNAITTFNSNVTISFIYTDEQLEALGLTEGGLAAQYFDESSNTYRDPIGIIQDIDNNTITIQTNHFTKFAVVSDEAALGGSLGPADIIATPASQGGPQIILSDENGNMLANFFAYSTALRIGMETVTADVDGDGTKEIITAPGSGAAPQVRVFDKSGHVLSQFFAFPSHLRNGVHVTAADVNGDGKDEIVVSSMAGAGPQVRVFDGDGNVLTQAFVYNTAFQGGVMVTTGDVDGDGDADIVTVPESNGGPEVVVMDGKTGDILTRFNAYASNLRGGYHVTTGDVNGDGKTDIVVVPQAGHGPQVSVFDSNGTSILRFFAFASTFRGGVNVSVGDVDNDGSNDIVVSPQSNAGPQVRTFNSDGTVKAQFFAYAPTLRGSFTSFVADLNGDGTSEIVTAPGAGMGPQVRTFNQNGTALSQFLTHHAGFRGGLNIYPAY